MVIGGVVESEMMTAGQVGEMLKWKRKTSLLCEGDRKRGNKPREKGEREKEKYVVRICQSHTCFSGSYSRRVSPPTP